MGIPSYFHFLLKNHKNILIKKQFTVCHELFVDANSLIYDCIHELKEFSDNQLVYNMVYDKIIHLVHVINPVHKSYICFDGVPAFPKMLQQRQRRFKSVLTKQIISDANSSWNTNHITPGTDFMIGLDKFLNDKFKNEKKIIFSGSDEPMEGEHKICDILRNNKQLYNNKNIVIYGLDADLIMLGLLLYTEGFNTYLYKETKHFQYISQINENDHYYFRIDTLSQEINVLLENQNINQSVLDYIFMCFLCGNDFMPHVPCIQIRNSGINILIDHYKKTKQFLIHEQTRTIHWDGFRMFVLNISNNENTYIEENLTWKIKSKQYVKGITYEDKLNYLPCMDTEKENYLLQNMKEYNSYILETDEISDVCISYLKILEWTWYYYNGKNKNNRIYYCYSYGPKFSDLCQYIPIFDEQTFLKVTAPQQELNVYTQLFFVLPYTDHKKIIPEKIYSQIHELVYNCLPELKNTNYMFQYFLCKYFWESHLHMNKIDIDKLNRIISNIKKIE